MPSNLSRRGFVTRAAAAPVAAQAVQQNGFSSAWKGTRPWIGPEYWANPLPYWRTGDGIVVAAAGRNRTLHLLTHQARGDFEMSLQLRAPARPASDTWAGFRFGARGKLDDYRHALILADRWIDAAFHADGRLKLDGKSSAESLAPGDWIDLTLTVRQSAVQLSAQSNGKRIQVEAVIDRARIPGNLALLADATEPNTHSEWRFRNWRATGAGVRAGSGQSFGPILWTQYGLSAGTLKVSAQFPPLGPGDAQTASLQIRSGSEWRTLAEAAIDPLSRTALFRVNDWNASRDRPYRVFYRWQDRDYFWPGVIRREPKGPLKLAVLACDNGYAFPLPALVRNVAIHNPDLLFFAGDQIYEGYGGFGFAREPESLAMLDYLRKFYQFGWTWRELLRDRPSIVIPDDHDVFQGNIWGQGGRKIPKGREAGFTYGGFVQTAAWVNAVQRTQCAHLPDPVDPAPVEQGIEVYFTELNYGGIRFAILEDRKFKTGPDSALPSQPRATDPKELDVPGAELLGARQEEFLRRWARANAGAMAAVLSQTIFCKVTTHGGGNLAVSRIDLDCGGWPQSARNRALQILAPSQAVMIHGDQHLGALVHHGVANWEDGPIAFMVPGSANGFPRAWWPDRAGENRRSGDPEYTGRYVDGLGNRITVLGIANPDKGSNLLPRAETNPEELAHRKGSGYGIVTFDPRARTVRFDMWRYRFDARSPKREDQFPGFPRTIRLRP